MRVAILALRRPQTIVEEWKEEKEAAEEREREEEAEVEVEVEEKKSSAIPSFLPLNNFAAALRIDTAELCKQA